MLVDEEQGYSIGSDLNFLIVNMVEPTGDMANSEVHPVSKWNICKDTNWTKYMEAISDTFESWSPEDYTNDMWTEFKV